MGWKGAKYPAVDVAVKERGRWIIHGTSGFAAESGGALSHFSPSSKYYIFFL